LIKNLAFRLKLAKQKGEAVAIEHQQLTLPIDPFAIANAKDIVVEAKSDAAGGVSGMLLRHGDNFGIFYATHIKSKGFQRFSVGHELGHYFLEGHIDHILPKNGAHVSTAGYASSNPYELEADNFAAGLLMPSKLFKRAINRDQIGLEAIENLAARCKTSLTATAIRYAELTEDAVAVILSTGKKIDYCCLSDTMKSLPNLTWLRNGTPVPGGTMTALHAADMNFVASGNRQNAEIDIADWFGCSRSLEANEEIVGLGSYGKVLTVLSCPNLVDDSYREEFDDEDEDDLIESWTPRFRK